MSPPPIRVMPLIPMPSQSDPNEFPAEALIPTQSQAQVPAAQSVVQIHVPVIQSQTPSQPELDYKSDPRFQEYMRDKMLEMRRTRETRTPSQETASSGTAGGDAANI